MTSITPPQSPRTKGRLSKLASGLDMSFHSMLNLMHKGDDEKGTETISNTAVKGIMEKVENTFPGALPSHRMAKQVDTLLKGHSYEDGKILLATSLSCDEVNRDIEDEMREIFGHPYSMGGLAGFCFGGVVGFGNMAHHIPPDGNGLVIYGPHVGIDLDLNVGRVNRRGHHGSSECCGPAMAALEYCRRVKAGECEIGTPTDITESQQTWVCNELLPYTDRILSKKEGTERTVELTLSLYEAQDAMMGRILAKAGDEIKPDNNITFLGGITINTPEGVPEYFLPKKFQVMNNKGDVVADLLEDLLKAKAPIPSRKLLATGTNVNAYGSKTYG